MHHVVRFKRIKYYWEGGDNEKDNVKSCKVQIFAWNASSMLYLIFSYAFQTFLIQESSPITTQTVVVIWPWFYVYLCDSFLNWWGIYYFYKESILWLGSEYCLLKTTRGAEQVF